MASNPTARASEMVFSGRVTASTRMTESEVGADSEQQSFTTTLDGNGYLWRPWFATLRLKLQVSQTWSEMTEDDPPASQKSEARLMAGEARLNLFPRSRFPLDTFVDIFDSRIETEAVGVALDDVNTLRRERVGFTQQYRTESGADHYILQALRTHVEERDLAQENRENLLASGAHRYGSHSVDYRLSTDQGLRQEAGLDTRRQLDTGTLRHQFRPSRSVTVESVVDGSVDDETLNTQPVRTDNARSLDNYVTWRSEDTRVTVRTHLGAQKRDAVADATEVHTETTTGSASVNYAVTSHLRVAADAGMVRTQANEDPEVRRSFENASLTYTPPPRPVGDGLEYIWSTSQAVGNSAATNEESIQSATVSLRHGLNFRSSDSSGRTVSSSVTQGGQQFRNSRGTLLNTLDLLGSAALVWVGDSTTRLVQFNASDARTRGREVTGDQLDDVDRIVQTVDGRGSVQVQTSRFSILEADASAGETAEYTHRVPTRSVFGTASASYSYRHLFQVHQLVFRSRLEYSNNRTTPPNAPATYEERGSWDNRLDYVIGLLTLSARWTLTQFNGDQTVTTVLSATRNF